MVCSLRQELPGLDSLGWLGKYLSGNELAVLVASESHILFAQHFGVEEPFHVLEELYNSITIH